LIAWSEMNDSIFFTTEEKTKDVLPNVRLIKLDLKTEDYRVLLEDVLNDLRISVSPGNEYLVIRNKEHKKNLTYLTLLNMNTFGQKTLHSDVNLRIGHIFWNKDGDKIVFWRRTNVNLDVDNKLCVYSTSEDVLLELDYGDYIESKQYDWLANEDKIIVSDRVNEVPRLRILDEHLEEERVLTLSEEIKNHWTIWGLDNAVLVQRSRRGGFWRLDLETEEWKKVF